MLEDTTDSIGSAGTQQSGHPGAGRIFNRRHFLGGAALAGLAAATTGRSGVARAAAEPDPLATREHYLNVYDFGARGDGRVDDTAPIQKALDAAGQQGGNVVLLPRGDYLIAGSLSVPEYVTLQGVFRAPTNGGFAWKNATPDSGSCLLAVGGKGKPDGEPLIGLNLNSTLFGVKIFYPEQTISNPPVEYPWTVRKLDRNVSLVDVTILNPWQAVDFGSHHGRFYISGLFGQPLRTGLFVDKCGDATLVENVHFEPFWRPQIKLMEFTANEGTAFRFGRTDWQYMLNCFAIMYKIGYHFVHTPSGDPNVVLTQCGVDVGVPNSSPVSVKVDACQPWAGISFLNGQFAGTVEVGAANAGPVKFTNCGFFWGIPPDIFATLSGSGQTTYTNCHFGSWSPQGMREGGNAAIVLRSGRLIVSGCEFPTRAQGKRHIILERGAESAVVLGNSFHGSPQIDNKIGGRAKIGMNATG